MNCLHCLQECIINIHPNVLRNISSAVAILMLNQNSTDQLKKSYSNVVLVAMQNLDLKQYNYLYDVLIRKTFVYFLIWASYLKI